MQLLQLSKTYSITRKGQVTIPQILRKKFGLGAGDEVVFEEGKNAIKLIPAKATLKSVYGSVKPPKKKITFKKMREIALEDKLHLLEFATHRK